MEITYSRDFMSTLRLIWISNEVCLFVCVTVGSFIFYVDVMHILIAAGGIKQ